MYRSYLKYFIGFFVTIGLIIILIVLLFGGNGTKKQDTPATPKTLSSLANTDAQVRMTIAGNVRATQQYYEVQITSDKNANNIKIIQGYEGNVVNSQTYANNEPGYQTFLSALQHGGYMLGANDKKFADDSGYCPLGVRYIFEIIENGKTVQRYWTSSCGKSAPRTYLGNASLTTTLFERQIPDYDALTDNVQF